MNSFPFDSMVTYQSDGTPVYDRAVNSELLSGYFHMLFGDGVMPTPSDCLQVTANGAANQVVVQPGSCNVQGKLAIEDVARTMALQAPDSVYDRVDSIVIRKNENSDYRNVDLYVLTGVPAANPICPTLTRNSSIYELRLANIFRPKNTSSVTQARITDTRLETEQCGIIVANPEGIDTTTIYNQYQDALEQYLDIVKAALDETLAGNLQSQINTLRKETPLYGPCTSSAGASAKTAVVPGFTLSGRAKAAIKFIDGNTAQNATINISDTGAHPIYYKGSPVPPGYITPGSFVELVYDGTRYNIVGDLTQSQVDALKTSNIPAEFSISTTNGTTIEMQDCYYIPATGEVHIQALITKAGGISGSTPMATIPTNYCPTSKKVIPITLYKDNATMIAGCDFNVSGGITQWAGSTYTKASIIANYVK